MGDDRASSIIQKLVKDTRAKATGIRRRLWGSWVDSFLWTWIFSSQLQY